MKRWIRHAFKYGLRNAIFYWREERKPENAPKVARAVPLENFCYNIATAAEALAEQLRNNVPLSELRYMGGDPASQLAFERMAWVVQAPSDAQLSYHIPGA